MRRLVTLWMFWVAAGTAQAQLPAARLDGVFPPAGTPDKTFDVTIFGADLDDVSQLVFSHAGITAKPKMAAPGPFDTGPQVVENKFVVTVAANVPAGHHNVRCLGKYGLSGPRTFVIDAIEQFLETEPNNLQKEATEAATLPAALTGQLGTATDVDWFKFQGQAGQRVIIDGYARRIDSRSDLVVALSTADGRLLAKSRQARAGDPFLDAVLPATGLYFVRIHDVLHAGGGDYPYRLIVGSLPVLDFVFPPAGLPGSNEEYTVYGRNLPGGQPSGLQRDGRPLDQLKVRIPIPADAGGKLVYSERLDPQQAGIDGIEYRLNTPAGISNPVLISLADAPPVREQPNNDTPETAQKLTLPCEVAGQFYPQRDADWYEFDAQAGQVLWINVISHRLGLPIDPTLVVLRVERTTEGVEQLSQLAWIDDVRPREGGPEFDDRTHDPFYQFVAPAEGTYRILIREGQSSLVNDPALTYRLVIRPATPDFQLAAVAADASGAVFLRKGGREAVRVVAFRRDGFDGPIHVTATGLPNGVTASELTIGPASHSGLLVLTAAAGAPGGIGQLQIVGKAVVAGKELTRSARPGHPLQPVLFTQPNNPGQPSLLSRLTDSLPVAVSEAEKARVVLTLADPPVIETARGGVVKLKYTVTREDGAAGNLIGFPSGFPLNLGLPTVNIAANNAGEFELRFPATTPPGEYSFSLVGLMQGMNYSRNPEAAAKAKERAERITKALTEAQQKAQAAQTAAQKAQTDLTTAVNEFNQSTTAKNTSAEASTAAANALKAATDAAAAAKKSLDAKLEDAALKQQNDAAQKAVVDATAKAKTAAETAALAVKKLEESTLKQKAAQDGKTKADAESQAAQQFQQLAQQEKQRCDQLAAVQQQQAALRGFNLMIPSTPVKLKIAEYPMKLTGPPESLTVKQGAMADLPVKIERLYGFDQPVNFQAIVPNGVGGVQVPNLAVAGNAADGKVVITAAPTATPGSHKFVLRATLAFNGQPLTLDRPFTLTVEEVKK